MLTGGYKLRPQRAVFNVRAASPNPAFSSLGAPLPPTDLRQLAQSADLKWLEKCLKTPLLARNTNAGRLFLVGVCNYTPHNWPLVRSVVDAVQPGQIGIEQAPSATNVLLPYPAWLQVALDNLGTVCPELELSDSTSASVLLPVQDVYAALSGCKQVAAVGKDIMDPFESFGFYPAVDYLTATSQLPLIHRLFGFLPGAECITACQLALHHGAQIVCLDASLKLQESWVRHLVENFDIKSSTLSFPFLQEHNRNEQMLTDAYLAYDAKLAELASAAGPEEAMAIYKVSKAAAAATLGPQEAAEVLARLEKLQPLKFRHFAKRARHMALKLKELLRHSDELPATGQRGGRDVVAVVGRQYVGMMEDIWASDEFWSDEMDRTFRRSVVEDPAPPAQAQPATQLSQEE